MKKGSTPASLGRSIGESDGRSENALALTLPSLTSGLSDGRSDLALALTLPSLTSGLSDGRTDLALALKSYARPSNKPESKFSFTFRDRLVFSYLLFNY